MTKYVFIQKCAKACSLKGINFRSDCDLWVTSQHLKCFIAEVYDKIMRWPQSIICFASKGNFASEYSFYSHINITSQEIACAFQSNESNILGVYSRISYIACKFICISSEDSNQPAHPQSLI